MAVDVDLETLHNAIMASLGAHTWSLITKPSFYKGARLEVDQSGPVVIVDFGEEGPEDRLGAGNVARHHKSIIVAAGVEWEDTNENVTDRNHLWQELKNWLAANRNLGGMVQVTSASAVAMRITLAGPAAKSYRGVVYTLKGLDYHVPPGS